MSKKIAIAKCHLIASLSRMIMATTQLCPPLGMDLPPHAASGMWWCDVMLIIKRMSRLDGGRVISTVRMGQDVMSMSTTDKAAVSLA
jgi:hypothetical protein